MKTRTVKSKLGMRRSYFAPIVAKPAGTHPTYGSVLDMGEAVLGHLSVTYATGDIHGDDRSQLHVELFVSGQLDAETTCDDLELSATVYGRRYADGMETSNIDDAPPDGGYGYIEPFIKADKKIVYRAVFLYLVTAKPSNEKDDADTRKNDFNPQMSAVSYAVAADNTGDWRDRKEFSSEAAAEAWILSQFGSATAYPVNVTVTGSGTATPTGSTLAPSGNNLEISFSAAPTAVFDNSVDVTSSVAELIYTVAAVDKPHEILVVFPAANT